MDGLQRVSSNESFSYSWVVNLRRSVHGGAGGEHQLGPPLSCRASLDASDEGSNNYIEIDPRSPWMNIMSNLKRSSSRVDKQAEFNFTTSTAADLPVPPPNNNNNKSNSNSDVLQTHHHHSPPPHHHDLVHTADQINGLINISNPGVLQPAGYSFNWPVSSAAQPPRPQPVLLHETADSSPRSVQKGRPPVHEFSAPPVLPPPPPPHDHHLRYYLSPVVVAGRDEYFSSSVPITRTTSTTHNYSLLRRWRRCSQRIVSKYLGFLRPPCRTPLGIRRMTTTTTTAITANTTSSHDEGPAPGATVDQVVLVDDRHPAASNSSSSSSSPLPPLACVVHHYSSCIARTSSSSTTTPRTTTTATAARSTTATAATVPHLSPPHHLLHHHHHNLLFDVDLETSIYDAVLHCKKSIADLKKSMHRVPKRS
ncbi:hypothetical protein H6P81_014552 [Aristolochia fimbriata]|uniref:Uncharacterized protein n=1 Tax=Aristolochia fimbriata TaxID=158543 RepID=A0AAV7EI57_ARIFI|nr:hypothetical protein H6P81_014552 [Aristolochia fimbriata]